MDKSTISNNGQTVKEKINAMLPSFSKGQKKLAEYILGNYDTAGFSLRRRSLDRRLV